MNDQPSSDKKFFDIVPQHKTVPNPTSRPIVTTNEPEQPDPMIMATEPKTPEPAEPIVPQTEAPIEPTTTEAVPETAPESPTPEPAEEQLISAVAKDTNMPAIVPTPVEVNQPAPPSTVTPVIPTKIVVAEHRKPRKFAQKTWFILLILFVVIVILDLLLDAGILKSATTSIPHTHFFGK